MPALSALLRQLDARRFLPQYTALRISCDRIGQVPHGWVEQLVGVPLGAVHVEASDEQEAEAMLFRRTREGGVELHPAIQTFSARSVALERACAALRTGPAPLLPPARADGELYAVTAGGGGGGEVLATIDRAAAASFGIASVGVHMVCFTRGEGSAGELRVWVAQRAAHKSTFPFMLDPTVAGGHPFGISIADNMVKEAAEEAGIEAQLAETARYIGPLELLTSKHDGSKLKTSVYHSFELEVPHDWEPRAADGEVGAFYCWSAARVLEVLRQTRIELTQSTPGELLFRPAMALVMMDWLVRHGCITAATEGVAEFDSISSALAAMRPARKAEQMMSDG